MKQIKTLRALPQCTPWMPLRIDYPQVSTRARNFRMRKSLKSFSASLTHHRRVVSLIACIHRTSWNFLLDKNISALNLTSSVTCSTPCYRFSKRSLRVSWINFWGMMISLITQYIMPSHTHMSPLEWRRLSEGEEICDSHEMCDEWSFKRVIFCRLHTRADW